MECRTQRWSLCHDTVEGIIIFVFKVIITDLGEIGENAIIVFEENVGVGAEEIVANQEYVAYTGDSEEVLEVNISDMRDLPYTLLVFVD